MSAEGFVYSEHFKIHERCEKLVDNFHLSRFSFGSVPGYIYPANNQ